MTWYTVCHDASFLIRTAQKNRIYFSYIFINYGITKMIEHKPEGHYNP